VLDPLAVGDDLADRNITVPDGVSADTVLAAASAAVRDAAGCAISETTSTVQLVLDSCDWIDIPAGPVSDVASLDIDGTLVAPSVLTNGAWSTGWRKVGDSLLLTGVRFTMPATATVTYTHGYAVVPDDIIDLVCGIASITFAQDGTYGSGSRESSVRLGDYSETQKVPTGSESPSPVAIPDTVRERLRARFGTSVGVVGVRR
jgi:hypothetical protein